MNKRNLGRLGLALSLFSISFGANAAAVSGQGTWETTLQGRDLDGDPATFEAYYDTVLNITWLADANAYADPSLHQDGYVNLAGEDYDEAVEWAAQLDLYGITEWRLPYASPINGGTDYDSYDQTFTFDGSTDFSFNISAPGTVYAGSAANEMAHLFYNTLGNTAHFDTGGTLNVCDPSCLTNSGPFSNIRTDGGFSYWAQFPMNPYFSANYDEDAPDFQFSNGSASFNGIYENGSQWGWAVHDGDVAVVPVPAALYLFGCGLLGLIGFARRKAP